jgi:hypothetical protein
MCNADEPCEQLEMQRFAGEPLGTNQLTDSETAPKEQCSK